MVLRNGRLRRALVCLVTLAGLAAPPAAALEAIPIVLDQAKVMRLPQGVSTIIVGNPLIADVSVQSGGLMVLTGKGYGTNVEGSWFWYESWVKRCIQLCEAAGDKYKNAG